MLAMASEAILKINEFSGQKSTFENEIEYLETTEKQKRVELNEVIAPQSPTVDDQTVSENLIPEANSLRTRLQEKKKQLHRLDNEIKFHTERVTKIPEDRTRANEALENAARETDRLIAEGESADNKIALILHELRYRAAETELEKLTVEVERQKLNARVDPIKRDLVSRSVTRLETELENWETAIKRLRKQEVREEQREASEAALTAHPSLKPLAQGNESLAGERKQVCLLYTSPSPRDQRGSRMPSSA